MTKTAADMFVEIAAKQGGECKRLVDQHFKVATSRGAFNLGAMKPKEIENLCGEFERIILSGEAGVGMIRTIKRLQEQANKFLAMMPATDKVEKTTPTNVVPITKPAKPVRKKKASATKAAATKKKSVTKKVVNGKKSSPRKEAVS